MSTTPVRPSGALRWLLLLVGVAGVTALVVLRRSSTPPPAIVTAPAVDPHAEALRLAREWANEDPCKASEGLLKTLERVRKRGGSASAEPVELHARALEARWRSDVETSRQRASDILAPLPPTRSDAVEAAVSGFRRALEARAEWPREQQARWGAVARGEPGIDAATQPAACREAWEEWATRTRTAAQSLEQTLTTSAR